jgi:rhamnogalacturonan endolyase
MTVTINGQPVDTFRSSTDNAMIRAGIHGQYSIRDVPFDASLLKSGRNTIVLKQSAGGNVQKSVLYDAVRLELDGQHLFDATNDKPKTFPSNENTTPTAAEGD